MPTAFLSPATSGFLRLRRACLWPWNSHSPVIRCHEFGALPSLSPGTRAHPCCSLRAVTSLSRSWIYFCERSSVRKKDRVVSSDSTERGGPIVEVQLPALPGLVQKLRLGALFGTWYLFNIYFFIYNKQVLKVFPFPLTLTAFQLAVGSLMVLLLWATNLYERPKISSSQLILILPMALVHMLGNLFTNMSIGKVAVSFTNTIKAMEPLFSVILSALFLGEFPSAWVLVSLMPIVGGVALASLTELSFNWHGFWSAMASNLTYQSRNVLSKKLMVNEEKSLDNISLFSIITIMSLFLIAPAVLFFEDIKFIPSHVLASDLSLREIYLKVAISGMCFHAYQQVSYMILAEVSPITHSIGNCVKRVVVIVCSILAFRTPVLLINSIGTGTALAGVFLYSRVKKTKHKRVEGK